MHVRKVMRIGLKGKVSKRIVTTPAAENSGGTVQTVISSPTLRQYQFIARYGVDISGYDVVRGWRADASYFYICKSFVRNNIGVEFLSELLTLGDFGIQYFVQSQKAFFGLHELDDALEKVSAADYYDRYNRRDSAVRTQMYELIENDPRNRLDRTFKDVVA